jgi:lipopolysaccharide/colanic/teichoic acid biosynthesis glycosyltransferase
MRTTRVPDHRTGLSVDGSRTARRRGALRNAASARAVPHATAFPARDHAERAGTGLRVESGVAGLVRPGGSRPALGWLRAVRGRLTTIAVPAGNGAAPRSRASRAAKRALDIGVALAALLALAPVLFVVAAAVKLESRGPLFYRAMRVGHRGRKLAVLKLRKMRSDAAGLPLTLAGDSRFTRIGSFLSVTHLDELPQLWQVLIGQMSLIGPRPEDDRFVNLHRDAFETILEVRPGISGWTQLLFIDERRMIGTGDAVRCYIDQILPRKVELDLLYAMNRRLVDDLKLLVWTPLAMLFHFELVFLPEARQFRLTRPSAARPATIPAPRISPVEQA